MKSGFLTVRWKGLQLVLAMLLSLHAGFAQAAMVMPVQGADIATDAGQHLSAADPAMMADGMPCHHPAESAPAPDHSSGHTGNCCDAGSCHCVAAFGLSFAIARIASQPGSIVPSFTCLSAPAAARPPDLRPPIA